MPFQECPSGGRVYTYLRPAEEREFWRTNPDAGGVPLPARAAIDGAKSVSVRPVKGPEETISE